jgi:hypothetical protein
VALQAMAAAILDSDTEFPPNFGDEAQL